MWGTEESRAMVGSEVIAVVIRAWPADATPNSTDQIPSGHFLTGGQMLMRLSCEAERLGRT